MRRRDLFAMFCGLAVRGRSQPAKPLFEVAALDHINIRASNPTVSAHFYQSLFGGELAWIEKIPPNPTSPPAESWYLALGRHYLSISPTFPALRLGPDLDHICPTLRGYEAASAAASLKERGIETQSAGGVWIRGGDGMLYQLREDRGGGPARPPAQAKPKAGDAPAPIRAPFAPVAIREITLRVADSARATAFHQDIFGSGAKPASGNAMRRIRFGDIVIHLVPGTRGPAMERLTIAIQDFSPDSARRVLRDRRITSQGGKKDVVIRDPDGISVQLSAA